MKMLSIFKSIDNCNMKRDPIQTESFPLFDRQASVEVILQAIIAFRVQRQRIGPNVILRS